MTENCIFCDPAKQAKKFWENEFYYCRFDEFPVSPGHALIIPKTHIVDISSLGTSEWLSLHQVLRVVIGLIETTDLKSIYEAISETTDSSISRWFCQHALGHPRLGTKPDAYNHGLNDGRAAGRTVDHLHWHIIPRFVGDMEDPRGGVRYVIPDMGNYKTPRD